MAASSTATVVFSGRPLFGHIYPMMPLAYAFRDAGHRVIFATGARFVPRLQALGFATYKVGIAMEDALAEARLRYPDDPGWRSGLAAFIEIAGPRTVTDLLPVLVAEEADLVVFEQGDFGAGIAAAAFGAPAVVHSLSRALPAEIRALAQPMLKTLAADFSVDEADASGVAYLDIVPPSLEDPDILAEPGNVRMRPVPWSEPHHPVPMRSADPLIYVTLGTFAQSTAIVRSCIDGLAEFDARIVVALGATDGAGLGPLPGNVTVLPFVDQARLLPHVDLAVHHGGSGTMFGALTHGIAQLVIPIDADQPTNARIAAERGFAIAMSPDDVDADTIAEAARDLKDDLRYRVAAAEVRAEIEAMPLPREVVPALVSLAG